MATPSFAPLSLLLPLCGSGVFLQSSVHHAERALDSGGTAHPASHALLSHDVREVSLFLPHAGLLVDAVSEGKRKWLGFSAWEWNEADVWMSRPTSWAEPSSLALKYPPCSPQLRPSSSPAPSSSTSTTENTHLTARFSLSFLKSKYVVTINNIHYYNNKNYTAFSHICS